MPKKTIYILIGCAAVLGIIALMWFAVSEYKKPGQLDTFAQCLQSKGVMFYGAFWCPHCQNQKAMFGKSSKLLPYTECSTPDGRSQLQVCKDKNITSYPTWEFADGTRENGEVPLQTLSQKTGCQLPL
ncbi:MAG: hypothetical protein HY457_01165 [Parcubacteria group bacterium]|nr:hypothetical protein [Parcubacteria group bacterium]